MSKTANIVGVVFFVLLALSVGLTTSTYVQNQETAKEQVEINNRLLESNQQTLEEIQREIRQNHAQTRAYNQCLADAFIGEVSQERLNNCIGESNGN